MSRNILIVGAIAAIAHEANAAYCRSLGDDSQPAWAEAPEWQRASAINGVQFHMDNPEAGDSASHDNWMAEKAAAGWVYGPEKNPDVTPPTHPCMVPFEELPKEQQFKDALFRAIIHAAVPGLEEIRNAEVASLSEQLATVTAERDAALAEADEHANQPKAHWSKSHARRKIRPMQFDGEGEPPRPVALDLLEAIRAAGKVEVAFSDGKLEVNGLPALQISGDAWRATAAGLRLSGVPISVGGPAEGPFTIAGYGLVLDGRQVAFARRGDVLEVPAGQTYSLDDDVVF